MTFGLQLIESSSLVSVPFRQVFNHPYIHLLFSFTSKRFCCYLFPYIFADPLPSFNWWAVSVGEEELKWRQLAHHQLMSQQGPNFSPHSKAKANYKHKSQENW